MDNKAASMLRKKYGSNIKNIAFSGKGFINDFKYKINKFQKSDSKLSLKKLDELIKPKKKK